MKLLLDGKELLHQVIICKSLPERMKGLLGRDGLPEKTGMLIEPCSSIHTFGMKFPIDVIFLDRANSVVKVVKNLKPNRFALGGMRTSKVIEMQSSADGLDNATGKRVRFLSEEA